MRIPPSGSIQNTASTSGVRATAANAPGWADPGGARLPVWRRWPPHPQPKSGFQAMVPIPPSGPIQNTSSTSGVRATAANAPGWADPGGARGQGGRPQPEFHPDFQDMKPIPPSGPIQNTSNTSSVRATAANAPGWADPGGTRLHGVWVWGSPQSEVGFQDMMPTPPGRSDPNTKISLDQVA